MTFKDALTVYMMLAGAIWIVFVRTEGLLKEDGLRPIYAFILKRADQEQWPLYVEHFVDSTFRFQSGVRRFLPSISRVYAFTAVVTLGTVLYFERESFLHKLYFVVLVTLCNGPFDVISIAKTRFLIICMGRTKAWILRAVYLVLDLLGGIALTILAAIVFGVLYEFLVRHYPSFVAGLFRLKVVMRDGAPNWDETLYRAHLVGSPFAILAGFASLLSAIVASCLGIVFAVGLFATSLAPRFRRWQRWIEYSTIVREHPLQIVSWLAIAVWTPVFWVVWAIWGRS
jgi:hypothetical protein